MSEKENIITKTYDLLLYLIPQLAKFPRDQKFILADRIETLLLDFLEDIIQAYYSKEKIPFLEKGNIHLERIRILIRLSHDLKIINHSRYELISVQINELGKMVGGWRKAIVRKGSSRVGLT